MKYLKLVQTKEELIDPQLDSPSVYFAEKDKIVEYFKKVSSFIIGTGKLDFQKLG